MTSERTPRSFAVIFVLGAPGAGKGTLSAHLAEKYGLTHYSVGDSLRTWMKANHSTQLAAQIRDKLANQGFLSSQDLSPFLCQAIKDAVYQKEPKLNGILVDGFPRCMEQLDSWTEWPFQNELPLVPGREGGGIEGNAKPDVVLLFNVTKENARSRYLSRARDNNDSAEKFERRFVEYEEETLEVVEEYRKRGILIEIDANGTKEENVERLGKKVEESGLWKEMLAEGNGGARFLV